MKPMDGKPMEEHVHLPDPQQQFLVHPMDLPEARKEYLAGWWLGVVASPQVFTALAAILWSVSNNYATPVLIPLALTVAAGLIGSRLTRGAWDYIPRKRHHADRQITRLELGSTLIKSAALFLGLVIFIQWGTAQDFPPGFTAYPLGMGAAIAAIMAAELLAKLVRRDTADIASAAVGTLVVGAAVVLGFILLPDGGVPGLSGLLTGAAILLAVWVAWLVFTAWQSRRIHSQPAG